MIKIKFKDIRIKGFLTDDAIQIINDFIEYKDDDHNIEWYKKTPFDTLFELDKRKYKVYEILDDVVFNGNFLDCSLISLYGIFYRTIIPKYRFFDNWPDDSMLSIFTSYELYIKDSN